MAVEVRKVAQPDGGRVETGVVQFGEDWPGVFIRGDNAFHFWTWLKPLVTRHGGVLSRSILSGLLNLLRSSDVRTHDTEVPIPDLINQEHPIDRGKFVWVLEKLCGDVPPQGCVDSWLAMAEDGVDLQHWVSYQVTAADVRAIDVLEAAEAIARGMDNR